MHYRGIRLLPSVRKDMILRAAVIVVREYGFVQMSMDRVAHHCGLPTSVKTIQHYFRNRELLYVAVVTYAKANNIHEVTRMADEYQQCRARGMRA